MEENKNYLFLKTALLIYAVVCIVYGIGYLIFPDSGREVHLLPLELEQ